MAQGEQSEYKDERAEAVAENSKQKIEVDEKASSGSQNIKIVNDHLEYQRVVYEPNEKNLPLGI